MFAIFSCKVKILWKHFHVVCAIINRNAADTSCATIFKTGTFPGQMIWV